MLAGRRYPKLLAPHDRGFTGLDGQAPIGAMQTGLEQTGNGLVRHAEFVAARPWHSAGSIIMVADTACRRMPFPVCSRPVCIAPMAPGRPAR